MFTSCQEHDDIGFTHPRVQRCVYTHTHTPAQLGGGGGGYMCIMLLTSGLARNVAVDWLVSQFMLPHLFTAYIYSQIPASTQLTLYSLSAGS